MNLPNARPLLEVSDLSITFPEDSPGHAALSPKTFDVQQGESVGLAGPSGSGKTLTALAIMGLLPSGATVSGEVRWRGQNLLGMSSSDLRKLRGREIALVPQDPMTALHPFMRVDRQVAEAVRAHRPALSAAAAMEIAIDLLDQTGIARSRTGSYPFQWSGGMRQRALIAMAIAHRPALLIADEPTTALDVTTQTEILELLRRILQDSGGSMLMITHDVHIVRGMADRVVRFGDAHSPMPIRSVPLTPDAGAANLLRVRGLSVSYAAETGWFGRARSTIQAVHDVDFDLQEGETLAIVGESGCGKSSLARALVGLERPSAGSIELLGHDIAATRPAELRALRRNIQIVFQDPFSSLNPRRTAGETIAEPLRVHGLYGVANGQKRVGGLIERVRLPARFAQRFPHEMSGGERQRIAIARVLTLEPKILVLDEPVTSLDAETREEILDLLRTLQQEHGTALVLIAHDLRLVRSVAHRVAVMLDGQFVEIGNTTDVFERPAHPYTRRLLSAALPQPIRQTH